MCTFCACVANCSGRKKGEVYCPRPSVFAVGNGQRFPCLGTACFNWSWSQYLLTDGADGRQHPQEDHAANWSSNSQSPQPRKSGRGVWASYGEEISKPARWFWHIQFHTAQLKAIPANGQRKYSLPIWLAEKLRSYQSWSFSKDLISGNRGRGNGLQQKSVKLWSGTRLECAFSNQKYFHQ